MVLLNLWSIGHFLQWFIIGRYVLKSWYIFLLLSIGWELFELILPYDFAREVWQNKVSDIMVNCCGYYLGVAINNQLTDN